MAISIVGMFVAAAGYLPPVAGAISQEAIHVIAELMSSPIAQRLRSQGVELILADSVEAFETADDGLIATLTSEIAWMRTR